jgi:hypothetical protein
VIGAAMKQIAKICGCEKWEQFTNHANRALGITTLANADDNVAASDRLKHARHSSEKSNIRYQQQTKGSIHNLQNALIGKQVSRPTTASILENKPTPKEDTTELKLKAKDFPTPPTPKEDTTELKPKDFPIPTTPKEDTTELKPTDLPQTKIRPTRNSKNAKTPTRQSVRCSNLKWWNRRHLTSGRLKVCSVRCQRKQKTAGQQLTKFESEIQTANQSLGQATKVIVAQRQELAASHCTIQVQQQRLFMLQHMGHRSAPAPAPQTSSCVLM